MSTRHLFNSPDGLVTKYLRGLVAYNPSLGLDEASRVVFDTRHDSSKVSVIGGGGSGHEPAWSGYVGTNLLAASVAGDIFASPTTKQVLAATELAPSDKGTIMVIGNYTGDCLHFGLATEKLKAVGKESRLLVCGDDVSIGGAGGVVGRRGLAGHVPALKAMGGAAGRGGSLDEVYDLGLAVSGQTVTIQATLDRCHVPGRTGEHSTIPADTIELGTGVHNEPGYMKMTPAPAADEVVRRMLRHCLDENDPERGYVKFAAGDETVLLVSNLGGMSYLEMGALVDEVLAQLDKDWGVVPARMYSGPAETSLNAPAFSITIINITAAAKQCSYSLATIKEFLDVRTDTHWESMAGSQSCATRRPRQEQFTKTASLASHSSSADGLKTDPKVLEKMLRTACEAVIASEPDLTKWDTEMGDGDCGETVKAGATYLLAALDEEKVAAEGSVNAVLAALEDITESRMGGTLGGILGILFTSLRGAISMTADASSSQTLLWANALSSALASLRRYTPAQVGDRTIMDTLIPFAEALHSGSLATAADAAMKGAESTRKIAPRLGRATYVGVTDGQELPPDPGAWAAAVVVKGLKDGLGQ